MLSKYLIRIFSSSLNPKLKLVSVYYSGVNLELNKVFLFPNNIIIHLNNSIKDKEPKIPRSI